LHQKFHHLVSFAKCTDLSVHKAISSDYLEDLFHLPLSQQAFQEFEQLEVICANTAQKIQEANINTWTFIWGNDSFSPKKAYKVLIGAYYSTLFLALEDLLSSKA
jgi:hypothetical protein